MSPDQTCFEFIKRHEGCKLTAYKDSAGIWTIGYGSITYEDGTHVKQGDTITQQRAEMLLQREILRKSHGVDAAIAPVALSQRRYDSLVSFTYNVGIDALRSSTLLKRIKIDPDDPTIRAAFMMWDKVHKDGELIEVEGLKNRRKDEADLYFS